MVIGAVQEWELEHGRPPTMSEWRDRDRPYWCPHPSTCFRLWGKGGFNKAIAAAGFTPRPPHIPDWVAPRPYVRTSEHREAQRDRAKQLFLEGRLTGLELGWELARRRKKLWKAKQ